jgi:catechol 2,3-dioxygenase-like lactoylglutathione lyase family enzyme
MSRLQLALNVSDLGQAIGFYTKLFGAPPAKTRPGYANFAVAEPPLKLVLIENPDHAGTLNHLGVEVSDTATVGTEQARLAAAGLATTGKHEVTCCYAEQDKFWLSDTPDGAQWEVYTVLADSSTYGCDSTSGTPACAPAAGTPCC